MLDTKIEKMFSIEAKLPDKKTDLENVLLIKACKVYIFNQGRLYSELDDQTFDMLNTNQGYGVLDVEFVFQNKIVEIPYPQFYTKCFVIRTENGRIKPMKLRNTPACSKINQNGELVIGIRYFFNNEKEINLIIKSHNLLIEGFIALGRPKNVYGIMCQLQKGENEWKISDAYTYKPKYADNIKYLRD